METLNVINNPIIGSPGRGKYLYFVLWQRIANSGIILIWAKDESEAWDRAFKLNPNVKHIIVKIDPLNMPVTDGRKAQ